MAAVELIEPYMRAFVSKPWGWEDWILNDKDANLCQRLLFIKAGQTTGICRHLVKDLILTCDVGGLVVEYLVLGTQDKMRAAIGGMTAVQGCKLAAGQALRIRPGVWYKLIGAADTYAYEASTFHDDNDVEWIKEWAEILSPQTEGNKDE